MDQAHALGFAHFLGQTDAVGKAILVILLAMSVATWYLIVTKGIETWVRRRRSSRFLALFWDAPSLAAVERHLEEQHPNEPFSHSSRPATISAGMPRSRITSRSTTSA